MFAPNTFDEFLKKLFVVNNDTMAFWNGDMSIVYEDDEDDEYDYKDRRNKLIINRRYIKNTHDIETRNYLSSYQKFGRMPEGVNNYITSIKKIIKLYNNHIKNRIFWCDFTLRLHFGFLIEDVVEDKLEFWVSIDIEVLIDYFKNNVLNIPDLCIDSRFSIMEIE